MAKLIQAIREYGPRVVLARTIQSREIAEYIGGRTSLNRGEIENVLSELNEALIFFMRQGSAVKLAGMGTFSPTVDLEGVLDVSVRMDTSVDGALNQDGAFKGEMVNRENIGKTATELKALWNAAHPTDLISG
jgi:hypothetical protein